MKVAVVGLGHVGIPMAASLAGRGHQVTGIDIDARKVEAIQAHRLPLSTDEADLSALLSEVVKGGALTATDSFEPVRGSEAVLLCVETPLDASSRGPDYRPLRSALRDVAERMETNALVSIESTMAPGTMTGMVRPLLEDGSGRKVHEEFALVHCPERVTSGRLLYNLTHLSRVLGAEDPRDLQRAKELYGGISSGGLLETDWTSAELSKTIENAYRDVQLAFANEMALICEQMGADAFEVRELVNSSPGRAMLRPGPGVGGHCLSKDSLLLASAVRNEVRLLSAARDVNEGMVRHSADLVQRALLREGVEIEEAKIVLLGGAYKENVAEASNSPGLSLYGVLEARGAEVLLHDPYMAEHDGVDLRRDVTEATGKADCLVLVTFHDDYGGLDWATLGPVMRRRLIVDLRGALDPAAVGGEGFQYVGLGRGAN